MASAWDWDLVPMAPVTPPAPAAHARPPRPALPHASATALSSVHSLVRSLLFPAPSPLLLLPLVTLPSLPPRCLPLAFTPAALPLSPVRLPLG